MSRPCLFLDRDGVINVDADFVYRRNEIEFVEGIFDVCNHASTLGYAIVVVTNQSGIGRGIFTEQAFEGLMDWMRGLFAERGAPLDAVYHCPYHPEAARVEYRRNHPWRKPQPGMLLAAAADLDLDLERSILVGDSLRDMQAAESAGIPARFLYTGPGSNPKPAEPPSAEKVEYRCLSDLKDLIPQLSQRSV